MFGIIRPCRNRLGPELKAAWLAHLCGMCLSLRDEHGHLSRLVTNYDGLLISAMVEAQSGLSRRTAGPCALRGMRSADVSVGAGARLAASVSLILASLKIRDHVEDGDGLAGKFSWAGRQVAQRWADKGLATSSDLGFDASVMVDAVRRQPLVEAAAGLGSSVLVVTEPTETATGFAVAETAVLAGRPGNVEPLREVGRLFGRVAHLIDAVEDLEEDRASGAWNPLAATGTSLEEARRLCDDAVLGIKLALREAEFTDARLVHVLLVHELEQSVRRAFGEVHAHGPGQPPHWNQGQPPQWQPLGPPQPGPPQWSDQPLPEQPPGPPHRSGGNGCCGSDCSEPGSGIWAYPRLKERPEPRGFFEGCGTWLYMCGTCQFCCRDPRPGPWSDKRKHGDCTDSCDCGGGDCRCGGGKGGGGGCDSCDCCCCPCD